MLAQLLESYPQDVRVVFRHFPLISVHDKAALSMQASEAAGRQGKFWEMHDLLFELQPEWVEQSPEEFQEWLAKQAEHLGLDITRFQADLTSPALVSQAQAAWDGGRNIGLPGTPFLLTNGEIWSSGLPMSYKNIASIIELKLLERRMFSECPPMTINTSRQYVATLHTERGDIRLELFADKAPIAVNNFIFLARSGWYDGVTFHRVIENFVAQAGDPSGTGMGGPGYAFVNELNPGLRFDRAGLLAMANAGPDTNGSQFFITFAPVPHLDGGFTIFGQVIQGLEAAQSLTLRDPSSGADLPPGDKILSIDIEER